MLLGDPRQSHQRTQSFHFPIFIHQSLDPAAQSSAQAPSSLSSHALRSSSCRQAQKKTERVDALGLRAVEVIICMITRDFSVISMTSQASLSLSLYFSQKSLTHNIGSASALPINKRKNQNSEQEKKEKKKNAYRSVRRRAYRILSANFPFRFHIVFV